MSNERQESKLIRSLGFWDLMGIAIGQIIGVGIMSSTGVAIGMTGSGVVLAFLLSPILVIMCIYPFAILGSAAPTTGGPYRYVSRIVGKGAGMVYLLLHITTNLMIATFALSFASYLASVVTGLNQHLVAMVVLTVFYITNLMGTKSAALMNKIISVLMIGGLMLFVIFGMPKVDYGYVLSPQNLFKNGGFQFLSAIALLSSATSGAQVVAELGGETKNPGKTIPKVMIISTFAVGAFYVLLGMVACGILPLETVANQPLSLVAKEIMPTPCFYVFVFGAALGATASTLNATLSWVTKPILVACDDGMLPKWFGSVSKNGVPYKLLTIYYCFGMIPLALKFDLAAIQKFTVANSQLSRLFMCVALFIFAAKHADVLENCPLKMSKKKAQVIAVLGFLVLLVLSGSLLLNLSVYAIGFLAALVVIVVIYTNTYAKHIVLENDLLIDYTTKDK